MNEPPGRVPPRVYGLLALMVLVWSVNFVVAKLALVEFPPLLLGALRFTVAGAIVAPIFFWKRARSQVQPVPREEFWKLLGIGLIGVGLNQVLFLLGLMRTSVAHAAILICLTPAMVLLLSAWVGHERVSRGKLAALALAISGIMVLQGRALITGHASMLGDLFVALAALTFALFTVAGKEFRGRHGSLTINTFAYAGSGVVLLPVTLYTLSGFDAAGVSWTGWLSVLYMAIFPSLVAYMIFYHALRYMPASRLAMFGYLQPFLAAAFALPILGERITPSLVAGGALVLAGVFRAERS